MATGTLVTPEASPELPAPTQATRLVARRAAARQRVAAAFAFAGPVVAAVAATFTWFRPGRFVAAGDISPFVRDGLADEYGWLWNHRLSGAGSTSAEIARALEVAAIRIVDFVGGSETAAQHLLFASFAGLAAFGAAYFARAFTAQPGAVAVAGLAGAFNPVVLVNLPNPLPLLAIGLLGVLGGLVLRAAQDRPVTGLRFAAVSVLASYLSVNPPLLVVTTVGVAAIAAASSLLAGAGGARRAGRLLVRAAPWALLLNAWWVVPFVLTNVRGEGIEFVATTDASGWAWSHVESSIANVVTLNASWAWPHHEYLPFAARLDGAPWVWLRWILPAAALTAPLLARGRRRVAAFALVGAGLVLVIAAKGFHSPLSGLNRFLYGHVPGYWLLREPMNKVGGALVIIYAALAAVTVAAVLGRARRACPAGRKWAIVGVVAGAVAMLAYVFPLWTGAVIRGSGDELPGARVTLPSEWKEAAAFVNESPIPGKALVLPLDSFYQMTTTWGYHGTDDLARQLLVRPVLQQSPGGYFRDAGSVESLMTRVERALSGDDPDGVRRLLQSLGVSHVLIRHDLEQGQVVRPVADDARLAEALAGVPGVRRSARFGVVDVYELEDAAGMVHAYPVAVGTSDAPAGTAALVAGLGENEVAVPLDAPGLGAASVVVGDRPLRSDLDFARAGRYSVELENGEGAGLYRARVEDEPGAGATLTFVDPTQGKIDSHALPARPSVQVPLFADDVVGLAVGAELRSMSGDDAPVVLRPATPVVAYRDGGPSEVGPFSDVGDCHASDDRTASEVGLGAEPIRGGVRLRAVAHTACVSTPATPPTAALYRLHLSTRTVRGQRARLCVWQEGPQRCAALADLPAGPNWADVDVLVPIEPGTTGLQLFLYADGDGQGETVAEYRDVTLVPLAEAATAVVDPAPSPTLEIDLAAGRHRLEIARDLPAPVIGSFSALQDCNAADDRTPEQAGLAATVIERGVQLEAGAHSACVSATVSNPGTGAYRLSLEARTVAGRAARVCVWQVGPDRCADLPTLDAGGDWSRYAGTFNPAPGTTDLEVYLYADGQDGPRTITEYRDLRLRPVLPTLLTIAPVADTPAAAAPAIEWEEIHAGRYSVRVEGADHPFVLALAESFGDGWELQGLPSGATAEHMVVDGYANGWRIVGAGDFELVLNHKPTDWARTALRVSLLTGLAAVVLVAVRRVRRRRRRSSPPPDPLEAIARD